MSKKKVLKAPFLEDGSLLNWVHKYSIESAEEKGGEGEVYGQKFFMKDAVPFHTILRYHSFSRGRSAFLTYWKCVTSGATYPMMAGELDELLKKGSFQEVSGAIIDGKWGIVKKGANYGITPLF